MAYGFNVSQTRVNLLTNANVTTTGAQDVDSTALDVAPYEGTILITMSARASGTGTTTVTVVESETSGGSYTAVSADALINPLTGEVDTFDTFSTSASTQTIGLRKDLCNRYVKVRYSGTDLDQNIATVAVAQSKYTQDA